MSKRELVIKKNNAVTDGYIPKTPKQVIPDKLLNVLIYMYEKHGSNFSLTLYEIAKYLGFKQRGGKAYQLIKNAIEILQQPILIRDFTYKGEKIKWMRAVFISAVYQKEEENEKIHFKIEDMFVEACKQKYAGYTKLNLEHTNSFSSKYALKLFEMYKRYENLPSQECDGCTIVKKDLDFLNHIFCTNYQHASKLWTDKKDPKYLPPINKGLLEIKKKFGIEIHCFYHKKEKAFYFTWIKPERFPELRIPLRRVEEFLNWYIIQNIEKIEDVSSYYKKIHRDLIEGNFYDLEQNYRLFLNFKYGLKPEEIDKLYDKKSGKFKDFV